MNDNQLKSINGQISKNSLSSQLQTLQANGTIAFCSMEYRNGYEEYDPKQFYAPFYIEFQNGEGWLLFSSSSIRNDRMNNQQWNSLHLKKIAANIKRAYLVIPDEISQNDKEKTIAENYQKKITGKMYSAIEDVCYQSELIGLITEHACNLDSALPKKTVRLEPPEYRDIAAEDSFDSLLIGCYRNEEHLHWILSTMRYNVRLNNRKGAIELTYLVSQASKLLLYSQTNHQTYKYFNLSGKIERARAERMKELDYPGYQEGREYLLYQLTEELSSPMVDVDKLIEKYKPAKWVLYAPVFVSFNGDIEELENLL